MKFQIIVFVSALVAFSSRANDAALTWLANHQEPDGHWDSQKYGAAVKSDIATTGLALLAFSNAGHSEKIGAFKGNVKRAVAWLKSKQSVNGRIGDPAESTNVIEEATATAIATMALCEAAFMAARPETRDAAQKAVDACIDGFPLKQSATVEGERTYILGPATDTPIVGWTIMALKSAKIAQLKVPYSAFEALMKYLDSVEHKQEKPGDDGAKPASEYWFSPNERTSYDCPLHKTTAIGCLCRQFTGWQKMDLRLTAEHFGSLRAPMWTVDDDSDVDLYYWYISSICTFNQGGDLWNKWNEALKKALLNNQNKAGDNEGSWKPIGSVGVKWGRIGQTAFGCLCLEVYYAYAPIYEFPAKEKLAE